MIAQQLRVADIIDIQPEDETNFTVETRRPESWIVPTISIMRELFAGTFNNEETYSINIIRYPVKLIAKVVVTYSSKETERPNRYDKVIYSAIVSLFIRNFEATKQDVCYITPQMIYHAFRGGCIPGKKMNLPPSEAVSIVKTIQKLRRVKISIVSTWTDDEISLLGKSADRYRPFKFSGSLLQAKWVRATFIGGNQLDCIKLKTMPLLYRVGDRLNQILRVPIAFMQSNRRYTPLVPQIRLYLLERIAAMKSNHKAAKIIRFDTIYEILFPNNFNKEKLQSIRSVVKDSLDYFVDSKYIKSYSVIRGLHGAFERIEIAIK